MIRRNKAKNPVTKAKRLVRWSRPLYLGLNILLPVALFFMVRGGLTELAVLLVILSKWRVFAVRPRHIPANLRANLTDFFVKLGTLLFIINAETTEVQLAWTAWYAFWLIAIKPRSSKLWMGVQAFAGFIVGTSALYLYSGPDGMPFIFTLAIVWLIASGTARHFLINYADGWQKVLVNMWSLFIVQFFWVMNGWFINYLFVPQATLIGVVLGYLFASIYDAKQDDKLTKSFLIQQSVMSLIILITIIVTSDWRGTI